MQLSELIMRDRENLYLYSKLEERQTQHDKPLFMINSIRASVDGELKNNTTLCNQSFTYSRIAHLQSVHGVRPTRNDRNFQTLLP